MKIKWLLKLILLGIIIYYINSFLPIYVPCFCGKSSWWNKCMEGTDESAPVCKMKEKLINDINDEITSISRQLSSIINPLKQGIPYISAKPSSLATKLSSVFPINPIPANSPIPNISFNCNITVPFQQVTTSINTTITTLSNEMNKIGTSINNGNTISSLRSVVNELNLVKERITNINLRSPFDFDKLFNPRNNLFDSALNSAKAAAQKLLDDAAAEVRRLEAEAQRLAAAAAAEAQRLKAAAEAEAQRLKAAAEAEARRVADEAKRKADAAAAEARRVADEAKRKADAAAAAAKNTGKKIGNALGF